METLSIILLYIVIVYVLGAVISCSNQPYRGANIFEILCWPAVLWRRLISDMHKWRNR